ncbi:hypothetical protein GCM10010256_23280 [Streptomyces coeruleorubidus]|nr:hypothetical protein GCM10010256_23280 [Streptomyces coeruleorubidus]
MSGRVRPARPDRAPTPADTPARPAPGDGSRPPAASTAVHVLEDGVALIRSEASAATPGPLAATPGPLAATTRLPLAVGEVSGLDDDSVIVNEEWQRHRVGTGSASGSATEHRAPCGSPR